MLDVRVVERVVGELSESVLLEYPLLLVLMVGCLWVCGEVGVTGSHCEQCMDTAESRETIGSWWQEHEQWLLTSARTSLVIFMAALLECETPILRLFVSSSDAFLVLAVTHECDSTSSIVALVFPLGSSIRDMRCFASVMKRKSCLQIVSSDA